MHPFIRAPLLRLLTGLLPAMALGLTPVGPGPLMGQDADWTVLQGGELRVGASGVFVHADELFLADGSVAPLGAELRAGSGLAILPGTVVLRESLRDILADDAYVPTLGPTRSYVQASQVRVPFTVEVGVTSWLTLGATIPLGKSRVEGEIALFPTADSDVGVNPALARYDEVEAFTGQVAAAAAGLPADQATTWIPWAERWVQAYGASTLFPAAGTIAGEALVAALEEFNGVLTAAGLTPVQAAVPLADEVLTGDGLRALLQAENGHFQLLPLPTQLLWTLGDVQFDARLRLLEGPALESTGRPRYGITALGSLRVPTGAGQEPRALFDMPMGDGHLGYGGGAAFWFRTARVGLSAAGRYDLFQAAEVERRVAPPDVPLVPASNLRVVERSPGDRLQVEIRPAFTMGTALWVEGVYRYLRHDADRFVPVGPPGEDSGAALPFPSGQLGFDPSVLGAGSERVVQQAGGGLRYHPPAGDFPVDVWARVYLTVAGSDGRTLKRTHLEFGGRLTRRIWGR